MRFRAQHTLGVGAAVVALAVVGASAWASVTPNTTANRLRPSAANPCGVRPRPPRVYAHVLWIVMENRPYGDVIGSSDAPYENKVAARCGVGARYFGITHPSLPNYIAATSGRTFGIGDDDPPSAHPLGGANLFSQVRAAGKSWRAYEEGAPGNCSKESSGTYVPHHNPPTYYTTIRADCARWDVPLGSLTGGNLARALASGSLPAFALITPDMCHDTHGCSVSDGDRWLAKWLPRILDSRPYRAGTTAVFLLWDEDDEGHDNHIPFIVAAPSVRPGTVVSARLNHYSLLRTTERMLGLRRTLGNAAAARSMRGPFHL